MTFNDNFKKSLNYGRQYFSLNLEYAVKNLNNQALPLSFLELSDRIMSRFRCIVVISFIFVPKIEHTASIIKIT